ncbi:FadR/GntR family transcriptional regulator [Brevundimonas subvibrioides]|uniref:FadR/GntR family transcriptional regulator n=1 Tax=Brevundimonas subvibrioides TaxID=74313 RepID=UPI0022B5CB4A|nr:FCD domain-containing protein [Brevundimonas subvibrioides]
MSAVSMSGPTGGEGGSLVQRAIDTVRNHIRTEGLRVGDSLPGEGHFAVKLGVSRAVMREAFGVLAALRLIDVGNGRKPRVSAIDGAVIASSLDHAVSTAQISVAEVWDVRRTIELRTAALAAQNRTDAEAQVIVDLAEAMDRDHDDMTRVAAHDIAFHAAIARAGRNALFVQIVASFGPLMEEAVPAAWKTRVAEEDRVSTLERHRALARAILNRDVEAAIEAMDAHFDASIGDILRGLSHPETVHA